MNIIKTIKAEIERLEEEARKVRVSKEKSLNEQIGADGKVNLCRELLAKLDTLQEQPVMIEWTGNNLKEVIEFTGKSPRFDEWFKTWDDYEDYVRQHGNIFKMFNDDGSHLEVPVGAWIVKTPDKRCVASKFTLKQPESEKIAAAYQLGLADKEKQMMKDGLDAIKSGQSSKIEKTIAGVFVKYGMDKQKEQMLKNAVEGYISATNEVSAVLALPKGDFKKGDKVNLLFVKKD